jgi:putative lipoic acid-binding regulatory protein
MATTAFGEVLKFPCSVKFRFIGVNSGELHDNVRAFFAEQMKLAPEIIPGNTSKSGKYLTLNVTVRVPDEDKMNAVYREGSKVPLVLHVL